MISSRMIRIFSAFGIIVGMCLFLFVPIIGFGKMLFPNEAYEIIQIISIILPILILIFANKKFVKFVALFWTALLIYQVFPLIFRIIENLPYSIGSPISILFTINLVQLIIALIVTILVFKFFKEKNE
jgi:hypothetical protein